MSLTELSHLIVAFRDERDWRQFHTPRQLSAALAIEAAELQEKMLWSSDREVDEYLETKEGHRAVSDELADVLIYALSFCDIAGIDPGAAVRVKLEKNAVKYPVEESRGVAR